MAKMSALSCFIFLSKKLELVDFEDGKESFTTCGTAVLANGNTHSMATCDHEEANTRMLVHMLDAVANDAITGLVRIVDTDVIVIFVGMLNRLLLVNPACDIWVAFGSGKNFHYIHINGICSIVGKEKSMALPFFHSFTGCDTIFGFYGRGKKTAWEAWKSFPDATLAFLHMQHNAYTSLNVQSDYFKLLERFCVVLYDKTSAVEYVDVARRELFCQKNRTMETIPPTQNALLQHTERAAYQFGLLAIILIWTHLVQKVMVGHLIKLVIHGYQCGQQFL